MPAGRRVANARIDGKLTAGGLDASASGTARPFADKPSAALRATIARADAAPLRGGAAQRRAAGHVRGPCRVDGQGPDVERHQRHCRRRHLARKTCADACGAASLARRDRGGSASMRAGLIAAAIGMPAPAAKTAATAWAWSSEPFGGGTFRRLCRPDRAQGAARRLAAAADRARVPRQLALRQATNSPWTT